MNSRNGRSKPGQQLQPGEFHGRIRRLISRAGSVDSRDRLIHGGAEQLESRVMLAVISPGGTGIASAPFPTLSIGGADEVIIDIDAAASPGAQNDVVDVAGAVSVDGVLSLRVANASSLVAGQSFSIITSSLGELFGSFLSIRNIDAGNATLNFVALQTSNAITLVATDLPTPQATFIIEGTLSEQALRLASLSALFAAGSSDGLTGSFAFPGTLATYGQRFVGRLTVAETDNSGTPALDVSIADSDSNAARLVLATGVGGSRTPVLSAFGAATLRAVPASGGTSSLSIRSFVATGFAVGESTTPSSLLNGSGKIGPLTFDGFTLGLSEVTLTSTGFDATVNIGAAMASLALGGADATNDSSRFKIEVTTLTVAVDVSISTSGSTIVEASTSGKFAITAEELTAEVKDVITITASGGIAINNYDSDLPASQTLVSIGTATIEVPKLGLKGGFQPAPGSSEPGLVVRGDGFSFGTLTVGLNTESGGGGADPEGFLNTAGGRLRVKNPALRLSNFSMSFNSAGAITQTVIGSFGVQADEVRFTPFAGPSADRFKAIATGLEIDLLFGSGITITPGMPVSGAPTGIRVKVDTIDVTLGFVQLSGTNLELNTAAAADEYFLIVAGNLTATLDLAEFYSSTGGNGPNIQISGTGGGFAIKGDGSFEAFTEDSPAPYNENPFNVGLTVAAGQTQQVLDGVADLPDSLPTGTSGTLELKVTWPDFSAAPSRFLMSITGGIQGQVGGPNGFMLAFNVTELQIDSAKIVAGEFPIVGLTSVSGTVSGMIMGAPFSGSIVIGLVRFDSLGGVLPPGASPDDIAASRLYVGARGSLVLPNGWGVQAQFAFSEKGFLNFYISSNLDIPLGTTGLSITGLRGGVTFNATSLPNIDDPFDLRNGNFQAPGELTDAEWEDQVRQLVVNQYGGTPGFLFEVEQASGQDWVGIFDDNADPGLYLPAALRTEFLNAGFAIPRKAGVSTIQTLEDGASWLLISGDDQFVIEFDPGFSKFSVSQITFSLPFDLEPSLPTGTDSATAGSISATINGSMQTLVDLFAESGRTLNGSAVVEPGADPDTWTVTDGDVVYTLTKLGASGNEILSVTGGDPTFESGSGMVIRLDAGFSLSSTGGSTAWRLSADAIVEFTVGGPANTKIVLLGDLSVGPAANPTLSVDTRLFITLPASGTVSILMLSDFRIPPAAATGTDPTPSAPTPFFSLYGNVTFSFVNDEFSFSLTGSQTSGLAVFDTDGLRSTPLGNQRLLLGAPSSPSAMDGIGSATVSFSGNKMRFSFAANVAADGLIEASSVAFATGDFTVEFTSVNVGSLGTVKLPSALYGAAYLTATLDQISPLAAVGVSGTLNLLIKINTSTAVQIATLVNQPPTPGDTTIDLAPTSFGLYGDGDITFTPPGTSISQNIVGVFGLELGATGAKLAVYGSFPLPLPVVGNALNTRADVLGVFLIGSLSGGLGFAGRLKAVARSTNPASAVFDLNAVIDLSINSTSMDQTLTLPAGFAKRLVSNPASIPLALRDALQVTTAGDSPALQFVIPGIAPGSQTGATAAPYIVFQASGNATLRNPSSGDAILDLSLTQFRIAVEPTQFQLTLAGTVNLGPIGNVTAAGALIVSRNGLKFDTAGYITITGALGVSGSFSFASATASVQFNTFDTPTSLSIVGIPDVPIAANSIRVYVRAELNVVNAVKLQGEFFIAKSGTNFSVGIAATVDFFGLGFGVVGNATLYAGTNPGLMIDLQMTRTDGTPGVSFGYTNVVEIVADEARVQVNTRSGGTSRISVLNAGILIMGVIRPVNANLTATITGTIWEVNASLQGSFLSFAGIAGSILFRSNGEFSFSIGGGFQIGGDNFGIRGSAGLSVSYLASNNGDSVLTPADLRITGSGGVEVYARVKIAGRYVGASVGASFTLSYSDGELKIRGCVKIIKNICKTFTIARFRVGSAVPPDDMLATRLPDGTLRLNVGTDSLFRNIGIGETSEGYTLESVPGDPTAVKVTAFGKNKTFTGINRIIGNFGSDDDQLLVDAGINIPMQFSGGEGADDFEINSDSDVIVNGDGGDDTITFSTSQGSFDGGGGDDALVWSVVDPSAIIGSGPAATGGTGQDVFLAVFADTADRVQIDRGTGQFRVQRLNTAGTILESANATSGFESLHLQTGAGSDDVVIQNLPGSGLASILLDVVTGITPTGSRNVVEPDGQITSYPTYTADSVANAAQVNGSGSSDTFTLSTVADTDDQDGDTSLLERVIRVQSAGLGTLLVMNSARTGGNALIIDGAGGNDIITAAGISGSGNDLVALVLKGGAGHDTITGSAFADAIDSGSGDDTVTGGPGTDTYTDAGGMDTFVESRDRDFFIASNRFIVGSIAASSLTGFADNFASTDEVENLAGIFEISRLTGGSSGNTFVVGDVDGLLAGSSGPISTGQQWAGSITLDGAGGSDMYVVTVFGISGSTISVSDSGTSGTDVLRAYGSDLTSRTDTFLVRRNFIAALIDKDGNGSLDVFDRINYTTAIEGGLTVDALGGDDRIVVDETSIGTTLRGGSGRDLFQFGQVFGTERVAPAVAVGDEISTVPILLGTPDGSTVVARLSSGPSTALTAFGGEDNDSFVVLRTVSNLNLRGEAGDDTFSVRAFEQVGGGGTTQGNTTVAGGAGNNAIEFVANAPINIEGGEGTDTVRMLGTFRADQYIVDATGIIGPGVNVTYSEVEILEINTGDGNDEVFIRATPANLRVIVFGGAGSDHLFVGAPVPGSNSNPSFANTLIGILGPVLLDGGPGAPGVFGLSAAVTLPSETDAALPLGAGNMMSDEQVGDVDVVDVLATAETQDLSGWMSSRSWPDGLNTISVVTLSGLGMGPDLIQNGATVPGGISFRSTEVIDVQLGAGSDTIGVSAVLSAATTVLRGNAGSDVFNVSAPSVAGSMFVIYGDARPNETLNGAVGNDRVDARSSGLSMTVDVGSGDDVVLAGSGDDRVAGGSGNDIIAAGAGNDVVFGDGRLAVDRISRISSILTSGPYDNYQAGRDIINPGAGFNIVFGDHGTLTPLGGVSGVFAQHATFQTARTLRPSVGGDDVISALASADPAFADQPATADGDDLIFGGAGGDRVESGDGRDWILGDHGSAQISTNKLNTQPTDGDTVSGDLTPLAGASGQPTFTSPGAPTDGLISAGGMPGNGQPLTSTGGNSRLVAIASTHPLRGGIDQISSGSGDDVVIGGTAADAIDAGAGDDIILGDHGRVSPFLPVEQRLLSAFFDTASAGGDDQILAGEGDDIAMGQQGTDLILGQAGNDDLIGGHNVTGGLDAADNIDAGSGDDVVIGDNGSIVRYPGARSPRFVTPAGTVVAGQAFGSMYNESFEPAVTGPAPLGGSMPFARTITILNASPTTSSTLFGSDRIAGGAGNDVLLAGNGDDQVRGDGQIITGPLPTLASSANAATDGDDYIEGNSGIDTIWGDLGQDDLVGGGSSLFGLASSDRTDGTDYIFGGDGTLTAPGDLGDLSSIGGARDADTIAGDNADILRLVNANGAPLFFNYDAGSALRVVPRVVHLLNYTPDGLTAGDTGGADTIHGEAGNDTIYGMAGNDALFGDAQSDDIIGGSGDDWIYGGTGADGVLGDDGRLLTARNGTAEPLFGLAATTQQIATTPDQIFTQTVFATGDITKYARFQAFTDGGNDVIFGGLGGDFLHGGGGQDAISGAEALVAFTTPPAVRPTLIFNEGLRRFTIFNPGFGLVKIPNFFLNFDAGPLGATIDDGADALFGDHGNDWLVGGTNSDRLFGGMGDDVLNADDQLDTSNGSNSIPDFGDLASPDIVFGGGGLDRLIANATNDRLIDWNGEFNQYLTPFTASTPTVTKLPYDTLFAALRLLGAGSGMDTRLPEPMGELGLVLSTDPEWLDQIGRPNGLMAGPGGGDSPSPGNLPMPIDAAFDVMRTDSKSATGLAVAHATPVVVRVNSDADSVRVATMLFGIDDFSKSKRKPSGFEVTVLFDLALSGNVSQEYAQ